MPIADLALAALLAFAVAELAPPRREARVAAAAALLVLVAPTSASCRSRRPRPTRTTPRTRRCRAGSDPGAPALRAQDPLRQRLRLLRAPGTPRTSSGLHHAGPAERLFLQRSPTTGSGAASGSPGTTRSSSGSACGTSFCITASTSRQATARPGSHGAGLEEHGWKPVAQEAPSCSSTGARRPLLLPSPSPPARSRCSARAGATERRRSCRRRSGSTGPGRSSSPSRATKPIRVELSSAAWPAAYVVDVDGQETTRAQASPSTRAAGTRSPFWTP